MKERKKELRKLIAEEKNRYSDSELQQLSTDILARVELHPAFANANTVLLYHSIKDEVQTHSFIEKWSVQKRIILPVVIGDVLELRLYTDSYRLTKGAFGIFEPTGAPFIEYESIDVAIIPGVAFDAKGNRLGRGKGYYDKLLPLIRAFKIGICFPFQFIKEVPTEPFDINMDTVLTK